MRCMIILAIVRFRHQNALIINKNTTQSWIAPTTHPLDMRSTLYRSVERHEIGLDILALTPRRLPSLAFPQQFRMFEFDVLLERAFRAVVSFALVSMTLVFLLDLFGRSPRTFVAVVVRDRFLPSWGLCEGPALASSLRLPQTCFNGSQSAVQSLQVLMKATLLALQAEGDEVDALVLVVESGVGRRGRGRGGSGGEEDGIEQFCAMGVAGGEVVELGVRRRVEEVALERQVVVRHAGFIVQKRIIYLNAGH